VDVGDGTEAVDAADELDVARAPRRVLPDDLHVFADREKGGFVLPRERQMDDARRHLDVVDGGELRLGAEENFQQPLERNEPRIEMNLKRADAGREIEQAEKPVTFEPGLQRVHAHPERDVEDERAVFDEDRRIARPPINDRRG
jgi:hypothetical protein